jgi:hypothetical protein
MMVLGADVPALDIDGVLYPISGRVPANGKLERRVVWALLAHMEARGFRVVGVHDYDEETRVDSPKAAMEVVFSVDMCNLHFADMSETPRTIDRERCAVLVLGNGVDVLSDWFAKPGDAFDVALLAFRPEDCE